MVTISGNIFTTMIATSIVPSRIEENCLAICWLFSGYTILWLHFSLCTFQIGSAIGQRRPAFYNLAATFVTETSHTIFQHLDGIASGTLTTGEHHAHIGGGICATGGAAKAYSTCGTALGRACAASARCTIQFDVNARSR